MPPIQIGDRVFTPSAEQEAIAERFLEAAQTPGKRNLAINAGAGTGKTALAVYAIKRLEMAQAEGTAPQGKIQYTAFNAKAKEEAIDRFKKAGVNAAAKTYNGLAYATWIKGRGIKDMTREVIDLGKGGSKYKRIASVLVERHFPTNKRSGDELSDAKKALARLFDLVRANTTILPGTRTVKLYTGGMFNSLTDPDALADYDLTDGEAIERVRERYDIMLDGGEDEQRIIDLIPEMYRFGQMAITDPAEFAREMYKERWARMLDGHMRYADFTDQEHDSVVYGYMPYKPTFLMCDEAQDTSPLNRALLDMHIYRDGRGAPKTSVVIIGDPQQAIFAFRGADSKGFFNSMHFFNVAADDVMPLSVTRRCGKAIVEVARQYKPDYEAYHENERGEVAECNPADVVKMVKPGDALISRVRAPLTAWRKRLLQAGIPCSIVGGDKLATEILNVIESVTEMEGFSFEEWDKHLKAYEEKRIKRMKNRKTITEEDIEDFLDLIATVDEVVDSALLANCRTLETVTEHVNALVKGKDDTPGAKVWIATAHATKGLEYDRVFAISAFSTNGEQERNLIYVMTTRARIGLYYVDKDAPSYFDAPPAVTSVQAMPKLADLLAQLPQDEDEDDDLDLSALEGVIAKHPVPHAETVDARDPDLLTGMSAAAAPLTEWHAPILCAELPPLLCAVNPGTPVPPRQRAANRRSVKRPLRRPSPKTVEITPIPVPSTNADALRKLAEAVAAMPTTGVNPFMILDLQRQARAALGAVTA